MHQNIRPETMAPPLYSLVDIGANLTHDKLRRKLGEVLANATAAGVIRIISTGVCNRSVEEAARLVADHPDVRYTAGVHPHDAKDYVESEESLSFIKLHASNPKCVAIGECGLDFNRNYSPPDMQEAVFDRQLKLACELQKPLFVHERDASQRMVEMLTRYKDQLPPTVIHCFTGTVEEASTYIGMGLNIGVTGYVAKKEAEAGVRQALRDGVIPLDRLLLETDSPFMYPKIYNRALGDEVRQQYSEQAMYWHSRTTYACNEPCALPAICEIVAKLMQLDPVEVARQTTANAFRIYSLQ